MPPAAEHSDSLVILFSQLVELFIWLLIIQAILSWLIAFGIINTQSNFVNMIGNFLYKITEPLLRPIKKLLPDFIYEKILMTFYKI